MKNRIGLSLILVAVLSHSILAGAAPTPGQFVREKLLAAKTKCQDFLTHPTVYAYLLPFHPRVIRDEIMALKDPEERKRAWEAFKLGLQSYKETGTDYAYYARSELFRPEKSSLKEMKLLVSKLQTRFDWAISDKLVTFLYKQGPRLTATELNELADTIEDVDLLYAGLFFDPSPNMRESQEKGRLLDTIHEIRKKAIRGEDVSEDKRALIQRMARRQAA